MESELISLTNGYALVETNDEVNIESFDIFKTVEGAINYLLNRKDQTFVSLEIKTGQDDFWVHNIQLVYEWTYEDVPKNYTIKANMNLFPIDIGD